MSVTTKKDGFFQSVRNLIEKVRAAITKFRFWIRKKIYKPDTRIAVPDWIWSKCQSLLNLRPIDITDDDIDYAQKVRAEIQSGSKNVKENEYMQFIRIGRILKSIDNCEDKLAEIDSLSKHDKDISPEAFVKMLRFLNITIQVLQTVVARYTVMTEEKIQRDYSFD